MTAVDITVPYEQWDNETIWESYLFILDKESPLPQFASLLKEYKSSFLDVCETVRQEHRFFRARYYTGEDRSPIVNPFHIEHLTRFMYLFSYKLYDIGANEKILDVLFYFMGGKCGINVFYRAKPINFFIPRHALGTVLGYGDWGDFLYITHNCTIGQNNRNYPGIGPGLIMGPESMILGDCDIGENVKMAAYSMVIDSTIPADSVVIGRHPNQRVIKNKTSNIEENVFYDDLVKSEYCGVLWNV